MGIVSEGNQRCCYQQVKPLPNTHRFVRLLLMDAGQGIRYVRPTHQDFIRKPGVFAKRVLCEWEYVPARAKVSTLIVNDVLEKCVGV